MLQIADVAMHALSFICEEAKGTWPQHKKKQIQIAVDSWKYKHYFKFIWHKLNHIGQESK